MLTERPCPAGYVTYCHSVNGKCTFCGVPYAEPERTVAITRAYAYQAEVDEPTADRTTVYKTKVQTRGVRVGIPDAPGQYVEVEATSKDDGPWTPPMVQVKGFKILEHQWQVLVRTVERALLEYEAKFPKPAAIVTEGQTRKCSGCKIRRECFKNKEGGWICGECTALGQDEVRL